jgi:hypothetical protein
MGHLTRLLPAVVYDPLVVGTNVWRDDLGFEMDNLSVHHTAYGGYWTLGFGLNGRRSHIEDWLDSGLARHVELYSPSLDIIWEGFVNKVSGNIGSLSVQVGPLLDMANRIKVAYSTVDTSVTPPAVGIRETTTWGNDTVSQARYGIISKVISVSGSTAANAAQLRTVRLSDLARPARTETDNLESSVHPSATVECLGYAHWLNTYVCDLTTTGTQNASVKLQAVLAAEPNGIFSTDYSSLTANTTPVGAYDRDLRPAATIMKAIVALGDTAFNRWTFAFGPGRKPFYAAIPLAVKYERTLGDPRQALTLPAGIEVMPWDARAGQWAFYTDLLIGKNEPASFRDDMRYLFIEEATFTVPWGLTLTGSRLQKGEQLLARLGLGGTIA